MLGNSTNLKGLKFKFEFDCDDEFVVLREDERIKERLYVFCSFPLKYLIFLTGISCHQVFSPSFFAFAYIPWGLPDMVIDIHAL
jgi:hypothetical protein